MEKSGFKQGYKQGFTKYRGKMWRRKMARFRPHRSFRRSYREDYVRELEMPGLLHHTANTFKMFFKHWKTFVPLMILAALAAILLIGLMNESAYIEFKDNITSVEESLGVESLGKFAQAGILLASTITTGGLTQDSSSTTNYAFLVLILLLMWLTTIFLVRHYLVGNQPKLRDALYNAFSPLVSTLCVLALVLIQTLPLAVVIVTYSVAVATNFLSTPLYALIYFIFAGLLTLLSAYWLSSSIMALVAVAAPGVYPMAALKSTSDLMQGHRIKFTIRVVFLFIVLLLVAFVVLWPIIALDLWLKESWDWIAGVPVVPFFLLLMLCFATIFATIYLYLFYRKVLNASKTTD